LRLLSILLKLDNYVNDMIAAFKREVEAVLKPKLDTDAEHAE
jgi:hypothetical protein